MSVVEMNQSVVTEFKSGEVYSGKIIRQELGKSKKEDPQLVLHVELFNQLKDPKKPNGGSLPLSDQLSNEVKTLLTFTSNEKSIQGNARDLHNLGFQGDDILVLAADHPDHQNFVNKKIFLQINDSGYWNLRFFKVFENPKASMDDLKKYKRNNQTAFEAALLEARNPKPKEGEPPF